MASKKQPQIHYSDKEIEYFQSRWKTEEGKERRYQIIQIMKTGSTEFGHLAKFDTDTDKVSKTIPAGKDLRGINIASTDIPHNMDFSRFHLSGAIFEATDLSYASFSFAHLERTSFNGSILGHAIFKGANMVKTTFVGADLSMAIFSEAVIDGYPLIAHKTFMEDGFKNYTEKFGFIDKKPGFYNMIKIKYKELGRFDEMIPFHILEMRSKRDEKFRIEKEVVINGKTTIKYTRTPLWFLEKLFFDICFGYGEKWYRVFFTAIVVVFTFSFLYLMVGPLQSCYEPDIITSKWVDAFYFSAVNFTNLGSQDLLPNGVMHRFLMGIESISGLFLITLIIVIFTRKMIRE
jgi:hypothetical protein